MDVQLVKIRYINCKNVVVFEDAYQINSYLVYQDFMKDYLIWAIWRG